MIVGVVRGREARIRLTVRGLRGRQQEMEAVVDSGYTGWLTLPSTAITALQLRWQSVGRGILADGSVSTFDVYKAHVLWDGRPRHVFVDQFDATPLVGMALLRGYEYRMKVQARGKVTIKRLPRRYALGRNRADRMAGRRPGTLQEVPARAAYAAEPRPGPDGPLERESPTAVT